MSQIMDDLRMSERRTIAKNLIEMGALSPEQIAECTKLALEEVVRLAREESE